MMGIVSLVTYDAFTVDALQIGFSRPQAILD